MGTPAGLGTASHRGLCPLAAQLPNGASFQTDGSNKYGVYSLFPGGPSFGSTLYSHTSTIGRFASNHLQQSAANNSHVAQKDVLFPSWGYTFGTPTPPPGSPYSPVPVAQLELFAKSINSSIVIQQPADLSLSQRQGQENHCDDKCCAIRSQKPCNCQVGPPIKILRYQDAVKGCSRTNPLDWSAVDVKKEPDAYGTAPPIVKLELASPCRRDEGIALRTSYPSMANGPGSMTAGSNMGGAVIQCSADDRASGLTAWQVGGACSQALAAPTLWQYPASLPVEPVVSLPVPVPPVGFQLVRDPSTGGLLLLPTTGIEPLQQTVVWPGYQQPPPMLLPSLSQISPPPLQLLSSASSEYLSSSTTMHQHTQTHGTRLVTLTAEPKKKMPLIKIENEANKSIQAISSGNMAPLVTTHVIYQHPTNLILSQTPTGDSSTQATSPVPCLTPPPEIPNRVEQLSSTVQDASNQTDTPICSEDDNTIGDPNEIKGAEESSTIIPENPVECYEIKELPQVEATEPLVMEPANNFDKVLEPEVFEPAEESKKNPDLSGLELLTNSIMEIESYKDSEMVPEQLPASAEAARTPKEDITLAIPPPSNDSLGGLNLLCALAEQRIMEESDLPALDKEATRERKRKKKKSKKISFESERKRKRSEDHYYEDKEHRKRKNTSTRNVPDEEKKPCSCQTKCYKSYQTPESKEEVKKFIASKTHQTCCDGEWPCMNAMELDMRIKLAELQRQYREKQEELSKLKTKEHLPVCADRCPRSKSIDATECDRMASLPTPEEPRDEVEEVSVPDVTKSNNNSTNSSIKHSSSKKRKVEKPKKLASFSGENDATETIVAKKPKTSFVGCLLKAKEKFKKRSKSFSDATPLRYLDEHEPMKCKPKKRHSHHGDSEMKSSKIRPKLKAEATLKSDYHFKYKPAEEESVDSSVNENTKLHTETFEAEDDEVALDLEEPSKDCTGIAETVENVVKPSDSRFTLTPQLLEVNKLRVLTAMGGLFYAGQLNALEPPDVYSITLDGERGNKPHIMSREEILRDAIVEVSPKSIADIPAGTRLCAYWSQQYRCLYPGSVAEPGTHHPQIDKKFVSVEFDDGDSGTIALEDIRLLPSDYPIIEYDPNPLLSLCKRRRRASTSVSTEEKTKPFTATLVPVNPQQSQPPTEEKTAQDIDELNEKLRDKKRTKRKKHKKLRRKLMNDEKKKKKKHKCKYENCKHRKHHKKHRRHKKSHEQPSKIEERLTVATAEVNLDRKGSDIPEANDLRDLENVEDENGNENPGYEVTMDDVTEAITKNKCKKMRDRQESSESKSKMSAFLPARQLWGWAGKGYKRQKCKGRFKKAFYKSIQRGKEMITVGDSAVFLSTGRPDRPYIGKIEAMFELSSTMKVRVKWFYHPEETVGCPQNLQYPGALFESPHIDENDVQTVSHKCEVLPLDEYRARLGDHPTSYAAVYNDNDVYYLAGHYDPTAHSLKMEPGIPFAARTDR
ncbi:unnamed protein product [Phaedon cochleariae]|uniref:BAH domain-containing protein n=1 Tax=Phaedon cochleariae TaxID=80249 RepID=A0A9N9WWZ9_PHACE|nr:unnamed protein product [Phaedon cochleariae]